MGLGYLSKTVEAILLIVLVTYTARTWSASRQPAAVPVTT
jgi:hypothetical protein